MNWPVARWSVLIQRPSTRCPMLEPSFAVHDAHRGCSRLAAPSFQRGEGRGGRATEAPGLGVVALPGYVCCQEVRSGELRRVLPAWLAGDSTITALVPERQGLLPSVRVFLDQNRVSWAKFRAGVAGLRFTERSFRDSVRAWPNHRSDGLGLAELKSPKKELCRARRLDGTSEKTRDHRA